MRTPQEYAVALRAGRREQEFVDPEKLPLKKNLHKTSLEAKPSL